MEKQQIETQVDILLEGYGYNPDKDDYVNIVDFVQHLGFIVGNAKLDDSEDGFLAIQTSDMAKDRDGMNDKIIGVNAKRSLDWKRFIIAHEFAHSVLHYEAGKIYLHRERKKGKDDKENDADYFAAALLMPRKSFKRLYDKFKQDGFNDTAISLQLASIFKVPFDSVQRRITEVS
ncbi:MAG: ImmA/IrrE family metallo-endopeptidase [Eubacteriales bacterium]|nr:ImmA/IrrE family metallo-endopeptidase [Eubacteriales bacterium]